MRSFLLPYLPMVLSNQRSRTETKNPRRNQERGRDLPDQNDPGGEGEGERERENHFILPGFQLFFFLRGGVYMWCAVCAYVLLSWRGPVDGAHLQASGAARLTDT